MRGAQDNGVPPDRAEFAQRAEPFRRELTAHCYRMLGSLDDAEDVVQETFLRAWRAYDGFGGRSSLRTWLYQIATNACFTALGHRSRRVLPSGLAGPADDPDATPAAAPAGTAWLQPVPSALADPEADDPAAIVAARDTLRLALIASLQHLPPRQRAVLLLRDVLAWPAAEVAETMGTSTAAVKSVLQRARARLEEVAPAADGVAGPPPGPEAQALLDRYMAAFERADAAELERALREDATLEVTGSLTWFSGKRTCVPFAARFFGAPGDWRTVPVAANGQPAAAAWWRGEDGRHHAYGIAVLTTTPQGIARITVFADPALISRFGLPRVHTYARVQAEPEV